MLEVHELGVIHVDAVRGFARADIEIYGIDHFRPSFSGMIFFNADDIDPRTVSADDARCAGRFSIFGHEKCAGDEGHCKPGAPDRFDPRRSHPLTKEFKRIVVTEALRSALNEDGAVKVTILVSDGKKPKKRKKKKGKSERKGAPLFSCDGMQIVTFA